MLDTVSQKEVGERSMEIKEYGNKRAGEGRETESERERERIAEASQLAHPEMAE